MKDETILKLIRGSFEDVVIAISFLAHNRTKQEIKKFFYRYGTTHYTSEDAIGDRAFVIQTNILGWKYYYYKNFAFYISSLSLQFYNHPSKYGNRWNPTEL